MGLQSAKELGVVHIFQARAHHHHQVQPPQKFSMLAEALSDDALDPIAGRGLAQAPLRHRKAQAGVRQPGRTGEHDEMAITGTPGILEDPTELGALEQPGAAGKALCADGPSSSRCQPGATFGAPGLDHLTPVLGGHPGTETMGAGALEVAGLECAFHGGSPNFVCDAGKARPGRPPSGPGALTKKTRKSSPFDPLCQWLEASARALQRGTGWMEAGGRPRGGRCPGGR